MKKMLVRFIKGMAIGIANIIPGVSGGTLALMLNIYEPLIESIHNISLKAFLSFLKLFTFKKENLYKFKKEMEKINISLLVLVILGAGTAIVLFSGLMTFLIQNHQAPTYGFFFGLIILSIAIPYKLISKINANVVIAFIIALALIVGLSVMETDEKKIEKEEQSITLDAGESVGNREYDIVDYLSLALSGGIAMSTMIMPGISGSFMLLLMGKYFMVMEAVSSLNLVVILVFAIGALLGLLLFSRLLNYLLKKHHNTTMGALTGLVVGSLWSIWPFKAIHTLSNGEMIPLSNIMPKTFGINEILTIVCVLIGALLVLLMIRLESNHTKTNKTRA